MGEVNGPVCSPDTVLASAGKTLSEDGQENSPHNSDSGHETSSPDSPLTPIEEGAVSPGDDSFFPVWFVVIV
ncbi:unnamed protein product [Wuchereria bancrofti]|uniref:Uncharacterized protein n=1 Tax=Wuchereria bancrofti TaxID=6293 RepID=A0A3P7F883_WUCBA|nr:unnamed protein product [Wuchereria bancrofti]